jgi:hypothetical protein
MRSAAAQAFSGLLLLVRKGERVSACDLLRGPKTAVRSMATWLSNPRMCNGLKSMGCRGSEVQIFSLRPFFSHVESHRVSGGRGPGIELQGDSTTNASLLDGKVRRRELVQCVARIDARTGPAARERGVQVDGGSALRLEREVVAAQEVGSRCARS